MKALVIKPEDIGHIPVSGMTWVFWIGDGRVSKVSVLKLIFIVGD